MRERAQRPGAAGQPRDRRGGREHGQGQAGGQRSKPAHHAGPVGPAITVIWLQQHPPVHPAPAMDRRFQREPPEGEQGQENHARDHRGQPPARRRDLSDQDMRLGPRDQHALPAQQPAPGVRDRIHGGGSDNECRDGAENQRQHADQHCRPVRRNVAGVVTKVEFFRSPRGVRGRLLSRPQVARHQRPGRGDVTAPGYTQDPFDLREQPARLQTLHCAKAVGRRTDAASGTADRPVAARHSVRAGGFWPPGMIRAGQCGIRTR